MFARLTLAMDYRAASGRRRGRFVGVTRRRSSEQVRGDQDGGLTVGDGVVQLQNQSRPTARQTFDEDGFLQRPVVVEAVRPHAAGLRQHVVPTTALREPVPVQMDVEIEVGVDRQPRHRDTHCAEQGPFAQHRDQLVS